MRDLNEYKAEIFRRSEEKIQERKRNRNRTLTFCVPLCLVLAAVAFSKLPDIFASDISTENVSSETSLSQIVIQDGNEFRANSFIYNVEDSPEIWNLVQSAFDATAKEDDTADDNRYVATSQTVTQDGFFLYSDTKYVLYFADEDGNVFMYTLEGDVLTNVDTKEKVRLSSEKTFEFQNKLGLIITWEDEE